MPDIDVRHEESASGGRYVARVEGVSEEAELIYSRRADGTVSADHTYAHGATQGTGAARKLVDALVADARRDGFKVRPACSYVARLFDKNPDWADLRV